MGILRYTDSPVPVSVNSMTQYRLPLSLPAMDRFDACLHGRLMILAFMSDTLFYSLVVDPLNSPATAQVPIRGPHISTLIPLVRIATRTRYLHRFFILTHRYVLLKRSAPLEELGQFGERGDVASLSVSPVSPCLCVDGIVFDSHLSSALWCDLVDCVTEGREST